MYVCVLFVKMKKFLFHRFNFKIFLKLNKQFTASNVFSKITTISEKLLFATISFLIFPISVSSFSILLATSNYLQKYQQNRPAIPVTQKKKKNIHLIFN